VPHAALVLLSLLAAAPAVAEELWERRWLEVRTTNFVLTSALQEKRSLEVARELETFRRAVEHVTNIGELAGGTPTQVYLLPNRIVEWGLTRTTGSYLIASMGGNTLVAAPQPSRWLELALRHDYSHFLVRRGARFAYPSWYDEGLADLLSTLRVENGVLEFGRAPEARARCLSEPWIGFERVLGTTNANRLSGRGAGMFYAQSWLLVHHLLLGRKGGDVAGETERFLALLQAGSPPQDAFEEAFALKVAHLDRVLRRYLRRLPYVKTRVADPFVVVDARARPLAPDEVAARLGRLALARGEPLRAAPLADAALASNGKNARALGVRAAAYEAEGDFARAEPLRRRAVELEPDEALHELGLGSHFLERANRATDLETTRSWLAEARHHLARSHRLDADNAETLALHGASYLLEAGPPDPQKAIASLEAAHDRLPSHPAIKRILAEAYLANADAARAQPLLDAAAAWESHRASEAGEPLADTWSAR
jgi:tetratricopeptide (TPR) repeat protein